MFLWFAGFAFLIVAKVFVSPAIDYRLVILGSLIPTVEMFIGGSWVLHSLTAPVALMVIVMLLLSGKRLQQRRWLGLPIGMFLYLLLDRAWTRTSLFWWPFTGVKIADSDAPNWESLPILVLMEMLGLLAVIYSAKKYKLFGKEERSLFLAKGQIKRENMVGGE